MAEETGVYNSYYLTDINHIYSKTPLWCYPKSYIEFDCVPAAHS